LCTHVNSKSYLVTELVSNSHNDSNNVNVKSYKYYSMQYNFVLFNLDNILYF